MAQNNSKLTGGCQCGAIRFRADRLGAASICHCRMCQKAFGGFFAPLVSGYGVMWMRGQPSYFQSSNKFRRGFCAACGTPLTYEALDRSPEQSVELAIGALDHPELAAPTRHVSHHRRVPYFDGLTDLPAHDGEDEAWIAREKIISRQHPDHDTDHWPNRE